MTVPEICDLLPGITRQFKDKMPIMFQSEIPRSGFFIKKGIVKVYNLQSNGEEQIVRFLKTGAFLPLPWLYQKTTSSFYFYEAYGPCELITVSRNDITEVVEANVKLSKHIFDSMLDDQAAYNLRITALEQPRATEKLEFTLYYLMYIFGEKIDQESYVINIKLTHSVLAGLLGLTRETTATEINKLKRSSVLSFNAKIYTVNKILLEKRMGEDSYKELLR